MTYRRNQPDAISNWLHDLEVGIGKRGSTFTDVDVITHDRDTHRFLFRELKQQNEPLNKAQRWTLSELAELPRCTVWFVRRLENGQIGFGCFGSGQCEEVISVEEYRRRLACWWNNVDYRADRPSQQDHTWQGVGTHP